MKQNKNHKKSCGTQGYYYYYLVGFLTLKKQVIYWLSVISEKSGPIGVKSKVYFKSIRKRKDINFFKKGKRNEAGV